MKMRNYKSTGWHSEFVTIKFEVVQCESICPTEPSLYSVLSSVSPFSQLGVEVFLIDVAS